MPLQTQATTTSNSDPSVVATEQNSFSRSAVITIIAVVVAASLLLVIFSVLIFVIIFYLRVKMRHMDSMDITDGMDSPPAKRKSNSKSDKDDMSPTVLKGGPSSARNINNSNNLSGHHFSTLPSRKLENGHCRRVTRVTGSVGSGIHKVAEEERYQSLPTLAAATHSSSISHEEIKLQDRTLNWAALQVTSV